MRRVKNGKMNGFLATALLAAAGIFFSLSAFAGQPGVSSAAFLKFAPSPRGTAMGEAYTSVTQDAHAAWWNPAGQMPRPRFLSPAVFGSALAAGALPFASAFGWALAAGAGVRPARMSASS